MDKVKNELFFKLEKFLLSVVRRRSRFRQWYIKNKDEALGRELLGVDKFGNRYYQYYSFHGLPTKRMCLYKFFDANKINIDPHFVGWLFRQDILPPTPEELEIMYLEHDAFIERALEWDEEQKLMIDEYRQKKKELDDKFEREKPEQLADGTEQYKIESWNPEQHKEKEEKGMVRLSAVDLIEQDYIEEYKKVMAKDRESGKDFNKAAYDEMKQARYYFEYLRTQEKLYQHEMQKTGEQAADTIIHKGQPQSFRQSYSYSSTPKPAQSKSTDGSQSQNSQQQSQPDTVIKETQSQDDKGEKKPESAASRQSKIMGSESYKKFQEVKEAKKAELQSNRYSQFREEFEDIFEQLLDKKESKAEESKQQ